MASAKRLDWLRLLLTDLADSDLGDEEVLSTGWRTSKTTHHGDLSNVSERIGDRPLKKRFSGGVKWLVRIEIVVEGLESCEETSFLLWPGEWWRVVPAFTSLHRAQGPVKEIAHVGEDLDGLAADSRRRWRMYRARH